MKVKNLYRGVFNLRQSLPVKYAHAYSPAQAKTLMIKQIAKEQGVDKRLVFQCFKEHPENYNIRLEIEYQEAQ
jgi:hypothetical protein